MKNLCLVSKITLKNIRNPGILCDRLDSVFSVESCCAFLFFLFLFFAFMRFEEGGDKFYCSWQMSLFTHCFGTVYTLFMGHTATLLKNIKNGSHGTIYTFKNYFTTVFLVFNFNNNNFNPNGPYMF